MSEDVFHSLFEVWVKFIFAHPVTEPAWYFDVEWDDPWDRDFYSEQNLDFITRLFKNSGELLAPYTNAQVAQGLNYLISASCSNYIFILVDETIPLTKRLEAVDAIYFVFNQVFAGRCMGSGCDNENTVWEDPLSLFCTGWPIHISISPVSNEPARTEIYLAFLQCMRKILTINKSLCQRSALLWLGGWLSLGAVTKEITEIIDNYLSNNPNLCQPLRDFAETAKTSGFLI